jgi:hypothetical protein
MQQPPNIGGQLLGFRPRKEHAVIERMQEAGLIQPLLFIDNNAVHQGNLTRGPAKTYKANPNPNSKCFFEGDFVQKILLDNPPNLYSWRIPQPSNDPNHAV